MLLPPFQELLRLGRRWHSRVLRVPRISVFAAAVLDAIHNGRAGMPTIADECKAHVAIYACRTQLLDTLFAASQAAAVAEDLPLARFGDPPPPSSALAYLLGVRSRARGDATFRHALEIEKAHAAVVKELRRRAGELTAVRLLCARARSWELAAEPAVLVARAREIIGRRFAHVPVRHRFSFLRRLG